MKKHWAVLTDNRSKKKVLFNIIFGKKPSDYFQELQGLKGALFSKESILKHIELEEKHEKKEITKNQEQSLRSMSSGEQKKTLLAYILQEKPDFIVLDNPFDHLDSETQAALKDKLQSISKDISMVQLASRKNDILPFLNSFVRLEGDALQKLDNLSALEQPKHHSVLEGPIPPPPTQFTAKHKVLIKLENITVSYHDKTVLKNIHWTIKSNEFWELRGSNGSGKTTLLSMVTGENPKGYGQELYLFGKKKGSGESIWDIKRKIGYFTPSMTQNFNGLHTAENMIISGLTDSVGLYTQPTALSLRLARQWLKLVGLWELRSRLFRELSSGQKRLIMCIRAMIKHPPLLILDEPTAGLDDSSAALFVALTNQFAKESDTTVIFVSHRKEPDLKATKIFALNPSAVGSHGSIEEI